MKLGPDSKWLVMLVSSSSDPAVFVLPKGSVEKKEKAKETAVRETLEEAGVIGRLHNGKLDEYNYELPSGNAVTQKMWILYVTTELDCEDPLWKERKRRQRKWGTFDEIRDFVRGAPTVRQDVLNMLDDAEKVLAPPSTRTSAASASGAAAGAAGGTGNEDSE